MGSYPRLFMAPLRFKSSRFSYFCYRVFSCFRFS